ncbi:MAG: Homoserine O-acetyltransferase [Alphaproteobacteria bacterium MarineAlpha5_Bin9]|nr:MAG: Homoserine O-acetyltransferase [Alphaproteobacteria bacterium MarineAlpha5_Bin9]|tara:strand:+ start:10870 stop:12027 length:1158 start_codon:yes stop_codon:yes gene_type:complete
MSNKKVTIEPSKDYPCDIAIFKNYNHKLESGNTLNNFKVAFKTYGKINSKKSNVILICHALTGDQFITENNPITNKDGWWSKMVGKNKPIDTNKFFIIGINVLGGCIGTTGPKEINPDTNKPFNLDFPTVTIKDMVDVQKYLIDALNIDKLFAVIGSSMGAMQVLQWIIAFPEKICNAIHIAGALKHSSQNIAFHEVGRQAVMSDPNWFKGDYSNHNVKPERGLAVARMIAHITYLSEDALHRKFGRKLQSRDIISFGFDADFQVESYLRHQGKSFVNRFDANSYLLMTRAMDYFDLTEKFPKIIEFNNTINKHINYLVISFDSDWLFPTNENLEIAKILIKNNCKVSFIEINTDKGHDSFLLNEPEFHKAIKGFLNSKLDINDK